MYLLHDAGGGTIHGESEFKGIDVPIMLSHCYTIPEKINAPDKTFYKINDAAHSPLWENTEDSYKVFEEKKEKTYER